MSLDTEFDGDLEEVLADQSQDLIADAGTFDCVAGPVVVAEEFVVDGIEHRSERSVLVSAADAAQIEHFDRVTLQGREYRVKDKTPDPFGKGVTITLGSPTE